jgi:hypothetical protein
MALVQLVSFPPCQNMKFFTYHLIPYRIFRQFFTLWYNDPMPKPKPHEIPDIRVDDAEAAFHKLEDFTRRIMAVPKREIDARMARERERSAKQRRKH